MAPVEHVGPTGEVPRLLTVLYDAHCGLCSEARRWAEARPALVPLEFVRSDSPEVGRRFPGLARDAAREELLVVAEDGRVYRESAAWIMCLYALEEFRALSFRLASPAFFPFAREAFHFVSRARRRVSEALGLVSDAELHGLLEREIAPGCAPGERPRAPVRPSRRTPWTARGAG